MTVEEYAELHSDEILVPAIPRGLFCNGTGSVDGKVFPWCPEGIIRICEHVDRNMLKLNFSLTV